MLDWFAGAVQSAKAVKEISQALVTIRDESMVKERIFDLNNNLMELQQQLMNAQLQQMELIKRITELEEERRAARAQTVAADEYQIHRFPTGYVAYVLKADAEQPKLFLCSKCYETGKKITLHGRARLRCPECNKTVITDLGSGNPVGNRVVRRR